MATKLSHYQEKSERYEKLLEHVFRKLSTVEGADYLLRKPRKEFHAIRSMSYDAKPAE